MYSIGRLANLTGVKVPTIRYYEQIGLMEAPGRNAGNQRRYGRADVERLSFIRHARALGFGLADIRELLALQADPERPCAQAHDIAARQLEETRHKLKKLRRLEKELKRITAHTHKDGIGPCSLITALADHSLCAGEH